jgi:hypothetical protein
MYLLERKLARSTPVYDHAGELLYSASRERATELMTQSGIDIIGTANRIKALRFRGPDPSGLMTGSHPRRQLAQPHRTESYTNPAGCWTIDRVPDVYRDAFFAVLTAISV